MNWCLSCQIISYNWWDFTMIFVFCIICLWNNTQYYNVYANWFVIISIVVVERLVKIGNDTCVIITFLLSICSLFCSLIVPLYLIS